MKTFTIFSIVCLSLVIKLNESYYAQSPYTDLWGCDDTEECWSFVDDYMVKILHRLKDKGNAACNNFYEYALGHMYSIDGKDNLFDLVGTIFDAKIADLVENLNPNDDNLKELRILIQTLKYYLEQCNKNDKVEWPPLLEDLPHGSLMNVPNWKQLLNEPESHMNFTWTKYLAEIRRLGLNGVFYEEGITVANNDSTRYVVELKIPTLEDGILQPRFDYILSVYNLTDSLLNIQSIIIKIDEFQHLASNVRSNYQMKTGQRAHKKLFTVGELKTKIPNIDWQSYFDHLFQNNSIVVDELPIQIDNLDYFKDIGTLIDQTDDKVLAFYILLRFLYYGLKEMPSNKSYESCKEQLTERFPIAVNYLHYRLMNRFKDKSESDLENLFTALKDRFSKIISYNSLNLSAVEQNYLQQKINKMKLQIGNLPLDKTPNNYNQLYKEAFNMDLSFWTNQWQLLYLNFFNEHQIFFANNGRVEGTTYFSTEAANEERSVVYFLKSQNGIVVPFEFMRPPFLTHGTHSVFRYSLTAFSIARELFEAFNADGIVYDENGNENEIGNGILQNDVYKDIAECSKESFSDVNGLRLIIETFYNDLPRTGKNSSIKIQAEGTQQYTYKVRKLFFHHLALYFTGLIRRQELEERLNGVVLNSLEFLEVFNCSVESNIKRGKNCKIF